MQVASAAGCWGGGDGTVCTSEWSLLLPLRPPSLPQGQPALLRLLPANRRPPYLAPGAVSSDFQFDLQDRVNEGAPSFASPFKPRQQSWNLCS